MKQAALYERFSSFHSVCFTIPIKKNCRETDARHGTGRVAGLDEILRVFHRQGDEVALGDDWAM